MKDRKIKRDTDELFLRPIIVSIDDMDRFERKGMKKIRPIKNTWYDWLINYIPKPIRKVVGGFMDNTVSLSKSKTSKQAVYGRGKKLSKPKKKQKKNEIRFYQKRIKKKSEDTVCRDIRTIFKAEEEKEEIKRLEKLERKKQDHNERLIKDRIIRDIRSRFEQQEDYPNPKSVSNFWNNNYIEYESNGDRNLSLEKYLNKIKPYLRNIIIDHQSSGTWK